MTELLRLESITLKDIGVFDDVRIDFPPIARPEEDERKAEIHVFTGPNGCGKSTLMYALAGIFDGFVERRQIHKRFRGRSSRVDFLFGGAAGTYGVLPPVESSGPYGGFVLQQNDTNQGRFFGSGRFARAGSSFDTVYHYKITVASYRLDNRHAVLTFPFAAFAYSGQRTLTDVSIGAIQEVSNSPFENAVSFDQTVRPQVLLQWIANNRAQAALARADGDSAAADRYDLALNRIATAIRDICDLDIEFRLERSPLAVALRVGGETVQFDTLPDGLKSIISWIADLSMRLDAIPWAVERDAFAQPVILFLDEIDIHLHPKWQRRVLPAIQKLLPNAQIFVSTHSPFVVGSVDDAWVYRLPEKSERRPGEHEVIVGVPSGAGKSYRLILEEIFGVSEEFDVETEALFERFYDAREAFLNDRSGRDALLSLAGELAGKGEEARAIVDRELRQLARLTQEELRLA